MSNLEAAPVEVACSAAGTAGIEVLQPREVPLGGPRALRVQRTLPQRKRSLIGAWCFIDHYGPVSARMDVAPHPHTGLQTVSWLFRGEVEHRDSAGVHAIVRPGELNLMTAGAGICHSEVSIESDPNSVLHGVQLWVALPDTARNTGRDFAHYAPEPVVLAGGQARIFLGDLAGSRSPVHTFSPLLGAQVDLGPNARLDIDIDPTFEHGVLCDVGDVEMGGIALTVGCLGYQAPGHHTLHLHNVGGRPARALLLGGAPFAEELVMWWNFVGRNHDDIVNYRQQWQDAEGGPEDRFGAVRGYQGSVARLPAPPLPTTRLRPRKVPPPSNRKESL